MSHRALRREMLAFYLGRCTKALESLNQAVTRAELFCQERSMSSPANQRRGGYLCYQAPGKGCGYDGMRDVQWSEQSDLRGRSPGKPV